jgi:hypothetical protein
MDIHKAIHYLRGELEDLNRIIGAIEIIAATYSEKRDQADVVIESQALDPENVESPNEFCLQ